jgi:NAD(P)-dependent dehydrogenase (short-subunit alcohol dehydrogenase family)
MIGQHQEQRILITGAAAGIGRAIAEAFMERGAQVHICDISPERLAEFQREWPSAGATQADVSKPDQVDRLFSELHDRLGGLDVLVNNAGISGPTGPVESIPVAQWRETLEVNISGQFYCSRRAIPLLKAAGGGAIVNIASTAGLRGYPMRSPYASSKWAVIGFTKTLAMELGEFNIRVNAICPGSVEGERIDRVIAAEARQRGISGEAVRRGYMRQASLNTFIKASDVANLALFLCSPAGDKISGQAMSVDGNIETARNYGDR